MNNLFDEWKAKFEEFKLQTNLGKMDAADAFEKQKEQLKSFILKVKEQLDSGTGMAEEQVKTMRSKLEELNLQLHLGKAETKEAFEEQRKKIEPALHDVYEYGKKIYHTGFNQAMNLFDTQSDWFKTNLEIMQLKFSLAKMDAKDEADELKKQLEIKLNELQEHSHKWQEQAKENMEVWGNMAKENMELFRNWMQNLKK
ncbi:MAG: hypothetical protein EAY81_02315 [Bacteroidetes bacterium]|nr:MAG: hypothetical protein EAY81_02315 [Bacteroidota bacterium]